MPWNDGLEGTPLEIAASNAPRMRVMAGPGTGKTFAMKRRVARLLEDAVQPDRILAVTFTRTAAAALVKELGELGVPGCGDIRAGTLHSFCFSLLMKEDVLHAMGRIVRPLITFNKNGVLQFETTPMLQDLDHRDAFGGNRDRSRRVKAFEAAWARLQSDDPGWPQDPADQQFHHELLSWLRFHKAMLIGELVPEALRYLRMNPTAPELHSYDHVVVDEYQDLNKAEQVLIDLIASNGSLVVVGDEDQSIYRFRHAHPQGIAEFSATHDGTEDQTLDECRRCARRIVELANHLIHVNHPPLDGARLTPKPDNPEGEVHIVQWNTFQEEAEGIAAFVAHLIHDRGYSAGDILILSPRRLIGYGLRDALWANQTLAHSFFNEESIDSDEAQRALSLLALLARNDDRVSLRYWLGCESNSWSEGEYRVLRRYCEQNGVSPWGALAQLRAGTITLAHTTRLQDRFGNLQERLQALNGLLGQALLDGLFPENEEWATQLRETAILETEDGTQPSELLDIVRSAITQPEIPESTDYVRVMSMHKSKGLTSRVTIVAGCIQGLVPLILDGVSVAEQQETLNEQRRLFYVAMTRAREILCLSSARFIEREQAHRMRARVRYGAGHYAATIASEFLSQLGPNAPQARAGTEWRQAGFD